MSRFPGRLASDDEAALSQPGFDDGGNRPAIVHGTLGGLTRDCQLALAAKHLQFESC